MFWLMVQRLRALIGVNPNFMFKVSFFSHLTPLGIWIFVTLLGFNNAKRSLVSTAE